MESQKLIGIILLVVGVILLYFGWQSTQSVGEQLVEGLTGRFSDETLWFIIAGAAAAVGGCFLAFFRK